MAQILPSVYKVGTATVAANGVTVTGQGTLWVKDVLPGDFFGVHKGLSIQIESVDSNVALTLANPWPAAAQNAAPYAIMLQSDAARYSEALRQLLVKLNSGNVDALASLTGAEKKVPVFSGPGTMETADYTNGLALGGLVGAANKYPFFTGAGTMDVGDVSPYARSNVLNKTDRAGLLASIGVPAFATVQQGGGAGMGVNGIRLGWNGAQNSILAEIDTVPVGKIWSDAGGGFSPSTTGYQKFPSGMMLQWGLLSVGGANDVAVTFPLAFTTQVFSVTATAFGAADAGVAFICSVDTFTTASFICRRRVTANGGSVVATNGIYVFYIATGRWF